MGELPSLPKKTWHRDCLLAPSELNFEPALHLQKLLLFHLIVETFFVTQPVLSKISPVLIESVYPVKRVRCD